jgi:hypothetical protein
MKLYSLTPRNKNPMAGCAAKTRCALGSGSEGDGEEFFFLEKRYASHWILVGG